MYKLVIFNREETGLRSLHVKDRRGGMGTSRVLENNCRIGAFVIRLIEISVIDLFLDVITMLNAVLLFNLYLFLNMNLKFLLFLSHCFNLLETLDTDARARRRRH